MPRGPGKRKAPVTDGGLQKGNLTQQQRLVIVRKKDEEPRWTQEDLARWAKKQFGLQRQPTQSTISNILKSREKLETMTSSLEAKSARPVKHPELDAALLLWLRDRQAQQIATNGDLVRDKARQLADLLHFMDEMTYSNGWMRGFLARHEFAFRRNQVDPRETHSFQELQSIMATYPRQDVFTFVSTNLLYRCEPKKKEPTSEQQQQEPSLVVGLAVNMDGSEKWSPVVVSRAKQPPSFQQKTAFQWNFSEYYYNGTAQMTSTIFDVWIKRLNQRMAQSKRRVLVVVDSAPSHINAALSHVRVVVHADTAHINLHPLSAGLATSFKSFYRKHHYASAVDRLAAGERDRFAVSQLKAMRWAEQAWQDVPVELIADAWMACGLLAEPSLFQHSDASSLYPGGSGGPTLAPPPPQSSSLSAVATHKREEIATQLHSLLVQLQEPLGRGSSHGASGVPMADDEDEDAAPHYMYEDATIVELVAGALQTAGDVHWESDVIDITEFALPLDGANVSNTATNQLHRSLAIKLEQLRGVIQSVEEETPPSEELTTVLAFLRRRQTTLRAELSHFAREAAQQPKQQSSRAANTTAAAAATTPMASASHLSYAHIV